MGSLADLADRLEKRADSIAAIPSELACKVALTILTDLVYHTPVDTSKALSNWIVTLDTPVNLYINPHYPGEYGSSQRASAQETIELAKNVLAAKKPGQHIYITNSAPYIRRLNEGYSKQTPAGFVERSVLIGRRTVAKYKGKG